MPFNGFTPDYFFPCAAVGTAWYPGSNGLGCEYPLQGQAYAGFLALDVSNNGIVTTAGSEYISQQLTLTGGQQYYVEFYVSAAEGGSSAPNTTYVPNLGMFFQGPGLDISQGANKGLHHLTPQIPNAFPAATFYNNTSGWTKISGNFTPSGSGSQTWTIIIGNFDSGLNRTPAVPNTAILNGYLTSYYFVDGVSIIPVGQTPPDYSMSITGTQPICSTSQFQVNNQPFGTTVSWSSSNPSGLSISSTGSATRVNSFNGQNFLTVTGTTNGSCGSRIAQISVWVGLPSQPGVVTGETAPSVGGVYQYNCSFGSLGAAYFNWLTPPYGNPLWVGQSNNGIIDTLVPNFVVGSSSGWVQAFGVNACGNSAVSRLRVFPVAGGGGGQQQRVAGSSVSVYPNPSDKELNFVWNDKAKDQPYRVVLTDKNLKIVYDATHKEHEVSISVSHLFSGNYYLSLTQQTLEARQQIIVKH